MARSIFKCVLAWAALCGGLSAGGFLAFSSFVMPALAILPPAEGMAAMRAINVAVMPSLFLKALMATVPLDCYLAAAPLFHGRERTTWLASAAGVAGLVGSFGVTMAFNVPLNDKLASMTADTIFWNAYVQDWTWWNGIRAISATFSATLAVTSMLWASKGREAQTVAQQT